MNKRRLKSNRKQTYSSKEKRIMVEEIRSGMLSLRQSIQQHQVSGPVLQKWNRWYFKTRLLKYYRPKSSFLMAPSQTTVEQLKRQLQEAEAQVAQLKLQNTALETMIKVAEQQLKIEIRKKYGSKRSRS